MGLGFSVPRISTGQQCDTIACSELTTVHVCHVDEDFAAAHRLNETKAADVVEVLHATDVCRLLAKCVGSGSMWAQDWWVFKNPPRRQTHVSVPGHRQEKSRSANQRQRSINTYCR
jgi:hypothetical protein